MVARILLLLLCVVSIPAAALPAEGNECDLNVGCVGPGGCIGERICRLGGAAGVCRCVAVRCTTSCGTSGFQPATGGTCVADESCNGCDDDGDGLNDEGLDCATRSLESVVCDPTVLSYWRWSSSPELQSLDSSYGGSIFSHNKLRASPLVTGISAAIVVKSIDATDQLVSISEQAHAWEWIANNSTVNVPFPGGGQAEGWAWRFLSDSTNHGRGFSIEKLKPECGATVSSGVSSLTENGERSYALLTGSGDTVFFAYQATNAQTAIWLEDASSGLDADLYVSTGGLPDKDSVSSATAGTSNEFIDGNYGGSMIFVAVHSRAGRGVVQIHVASRLAVSRHNQLVCTSFNPTPNDKTLIRKMVTTAQRRFWAMTEGKAAVESVTLSYTGCLGCDVCIHGFPGRAYAGAGAVTLFSNELRNDIPESNGPTQGGAVLAHEWGHSLLGLGDEYEDHGSSPDGVCHFDDLCLPSMMDDHGISTNLCTSMAHGGFTSISHICPTICGPHLCAVANKSACGVCNQCNACPVQGPSNWTQLANTNKVDGATIPNITPDQSSLIYYDIPILVVP